MTCKAWESTSFLLRKCVQFKYFLTKSWILKLEFDHCKWAAACTVVLNLNLLLSMCGTGKYLLHTYNSSIVTVAWFIPQYLPSLPYLTILPGRRQDMCCLIVTVLLPMTDNVATLASVSSPIWLSALGSCWHLSDFRINLWSIPCVHLPFICILFSLWLWMGYLHRGSRCSVEIRFLPTAKW